MDCSCNMHYTIPIAITKIDGYGKKEEYRENYIQKKAAVAAAKSMNF